MQHMYSGVHRWDSDKWGLHSGRKYGAALELQQLGVEAQKAKLMPANDVAFALPHDIWGLLSTTFHRQHRLKPEKDNV
jgi:hypothetical protein